MAQTPEELRAWREEWQRMSDARQAELEVQADLANAEKLRAENERAKARGKRDRKR